MDIHWDDRKDALLLTNRHIGFEQVVAKIVAGDFLAVEGHWNEERYPNQRVFVLAIDGYAYLVPFVESPKAIFLKTIIPSRKATKRYLRGGCHDA